MNSSKLRGSAEWLSAAVFSASGADASRMPSAQQSFTSPVFDSTLQTPFPFTFPFVVPLLPFAPFAPFGRAGFSDPYRASLAPVMHSLITFGGSPYSEPWNGYRVYTLLL